MVSHAVQMLSSLSPIMCIVSPKYNRFLDCANYSREWNMLQLREEVSKIVLYKIQRTLMGWSMLTLVYGYLPIDLSVKCFGCTWNIA
jgi:hypothetical protein